MSLPTWIFRAVKCPPTRVLFGCDTVFDEDKEGVIGDDLPDNWVCPVCDSPRSMFKLVGDSGLDAEAENCSLRSGLRSITAIADYHSPANSILSELNYK